MTINDTRLITFEKNGHGPIVVCHLNRFGNRDINILHSNLTSIGGKIPISGFNRNDRGLGMTLKSKVKVGDYRVDRDNEREA